MENKRIFIYKVFIDYNNFIFKPTYTHYKIIKEKHDAYFIVNEHDLKLYKDTILVFKSCDYILNGAINTESTENTKTYESGFLYDINTPYQITKKKISTIKQNVDELFETDVQNFLNNLSKFKRNYENNKIIYN